MKYLLMILVISLTAGCSTTVTTHEVFPDPPGVLMLPPIQLKTIKQK